MDNNFEKWFQQVMDDEAESILADIDSDPNVRVAEAPDVIYDKLAEQIHEHQLQHRVLTDEERELIRLGKRYKRSRKWNKVLVALVAIVAIMGIGVTCMGGPEKVAKKVEGLFGGREQTIVDSDGERTEGIQTVSEVEALEQIKEEFNFDPVKLNYIPEGMAFSEAIIDKNLQSIQLIYENTDKVLLYAMKPNYRTSSTSTDVEDTLLKSYNVSVSNVNVNVKQYLVEENEGERWKATFEYQETQYSLMSNGLKEKEFIEIVENLYFS